MNPNKEHTVPFSRKKIISVIRTNLFALLFFVAGVVLFTVRPTERTGLFQLVAIPLILLFGFALISAVRKLNTQSPGLVISSKGILENSSFFPVGVISWRDIVNMYIRQYKSTRWLMIEVQNPEQYFAQDNLLIHTVQKLNNTFGGSSIFLSVGLLDIEFDEMVELIQEYHKNYGSA
jgi:hypothetical protein